MGITSRRISAIRSSASLTIVLACHKSLHTSLMIRRLVFVRKNISTSASLFRIGDLWLESFVYARLKP
jgi:hypothetical protein